MAEPWYDYHREFLYARAISLPASELGDWYEKIKADVQFWPCYQREGIARAVIYNLPLCHMQAVSTHITMVEGEAAALQNHPAGLVPAWQPW